MTATALPTAQTIRKYIELGAECDDTFETAFYLDLADAPAEFAPVFQQLSGGDPEDRNCWYSCTVGVELDDEGEMASFSIIAHEHEECMTPRFAAWLAQVIQERNYLALREEAINFVSGRAQ
jgi:hypothetical protein